MVGYNMIHEFVVCGNGIPIDNHCRIIDENISLLGALEKYQYMVESQQVHIN